MIRIICAECKNAYLQNKNESLVCPSCEATFPQEKENLLLGVQYYNEENFVEADNCLMKYIVTNSSEPLSLFYKAFCDARDFDEDTTSLNDTYKKIINAFDDVSDEEFPEFIAIANDETEKIEKLLTENHIRLFADADAEKIKKQVEIILNIQNEAKTFRNALSALVADFNENSSRKISAKFSDCFFVESDIAAEIGEIKYQKICDNVASHTVFTGILTNDIKNLEIYFRCIVMFFQKSYDKYKFLLEQSEKFTKLAELLEIGQYNTLKGTGAVADKLKSISYEFLQESYKEHFDEQIEMQTETVVIIEPQVSEEPVTIEDSSAEEFTEEVVEEVVEAEETETEITEATNTAEETLEENTADADVIEIEVQETAEEAETEITETANTEEEIVEENIADADIIEIDVQEAAEETAEEIETISSTAESENIVSEEISDEELEAIVETVNEEDSIVEIPVEQEETGTDTVIPEEGNKDHIIVEEVIFDDSDAPEADEANLNSDDKKTVAGKPKKAKGHKGLILAILILVLAGLFAGYKYGPNLINGYKYDKAVDLAESGNYSEAITAFKALGDYADSKEMATECEYNYALKLEEDGKFAEAKLIFEALDIYADSRTRAQACAYSEAKQALENKNFKNASKLFTELNDYGDSKEMVKECSYRQALALMEDKDYKSAIEILTTIKKYSDSKDKILEAKYMYVTDNFDKENKTTVKYLNELTTAEYRNSADLRQELLGSSQVMSEDVKAFVNYSTTDLETSLTQLDNTRPIYFHVVVGDKSLYGQTLTLKYTTAFGYSQRKTVTLSENDNVAVMSYPATQHKNYTVEFELLDSTGKKVAGQKISF